VGVGHGASTAQVQVTHTAPARRPALCASLFDALGREGALLLTATVAIVARDSITEIVFAVS
jgi:hypothetical protein